ncbi:LamG-like jellyroll fold domain-containing protein [Sphingobacterium detergens]
MKRYFNRIKVAICALAILTVWAGCTKYENPPAVYEDLEQGGDGTVKRKVLFISIDGAVGAEIKKIMPTNIAELLKTSKYTFESVANNNTKNAATWMTMMSGVSADMHGIEDDSYIPKPNENNPHATPVGYPSILYRISTLAPTTKSFVVARDQAINTKLLVSADETFDATSDEAVKKQVVDVLAKKNPGIAIVQFKDVLTAGEQYGFSASQTGYVDAVKKVDGYIGEILTALKARTNYKTEDWLVILTSNHGGVDKSYGGDSFAERNTFTIFQNNNFKQLELKTEMIKSMRFFGFYDAGQSSYTYYNPIAFRGRNNPVLANETMYDVAKTGEFTVDAKVKMNPTNGAFDYASNAPFLGKNAARTGSTSGWAFFKSGNALTFFLADGSTNVQPGMGPVSSSGEWTHIAAVVSTINNVPTVKVYVNGLKTGEASSATLNLSKALSTTGLTFGYFPYIFSGRPVDMQLCDVHIYNKALDEAAVKKNATRVGIPDAEFAGSGLIGYWPMESLVNNKFMNKITGNPDIEAQGSSRTVLSGNNLPYVDPNAILIQPEDMFTQIFYWLEIQTQRTWNLQGQVFLNKYEVEFLKP